MQPTVGVNGWLYALDDPQGGAHISVAALLDMGLEEQSLQLASRVLLRALDLVQGELQGGRGGQPVLQGRELLPGEGPGVRREGDQ